ncbi:SHOCT domain-containing protein (plasmid) [Halorubrum salinarum]|uniref:SHOCT domain-containing protein n=1 Tax=Halorubrum salinarum TaxID=2739057 RepID=A0A7D4D1F9_9EURY|nr:SHOCT domain-containing protein [Halorubrum salinarum]QKG94343.1 SHOCT domain-containing protein [Halorubrum salinarum]
MTSQFEILRRNGLKTGLVAVPLLVGASGTAAVHGGGVMGGGWGDMGGLGWFGMLGGGMLLWTLLLIGLVLALVYGVERGNGTENGDTALAELRERYARGELSDEEFDEHKKQLEG